MSLKHHIASVLEKTKIGKRIVREKRYRIVLVAGINFSVNLLYALYNGFLGLMNYSLWFTVMCTYYIILSTMRFSAVSCEHRNRTAYNPQTEYFVMRLSGILLIILSCVLIGVLYISQSQNIAVKHGTIIMITIASYTFYKITMAIIRAVKERKDSSPLLRTIRNIGYADVAVSVLTLQRSMLVSFRGMSNPGRLTMNYLTGAAVCGFVLALGIITILQSRRKEGV